MAAAPPGPPPYLRLGVVVPFDMALDQELWRWTPEGVSLMLTRTPYEPLPVTVELAKAIGDVDVVERAVRDLAVAGPAAYAYGCTSGSFVHGVAGEKRLSESMAAAGGAPAVTTSGAILQALAELGTSRVAIATPYDRKVTEKLDVFLEEAGHSVVGSAYLGLHGGIWKVPYADTARLVREANTPAAEVIVVSCTNLPTYDVIAPLEEDLGKPVVTASQATMWAALRLLGHRLAEPAQALATR